MKIAPELQGIPPEQVHGRAADLWTGEIGFGQWQASAPVAFDTRTWSWEGLLPESRHNEELRVDVQAIGFEFEVRREAARISRVQCLARGRFGVHTEHRGRVTDETTITLPGYPRIDCRFLGAQAGSLSLRPAFLTQRDSGLARYGERLWNLRSVNNLASQRSSFPLARFGYEFSAGGEVIAAVETAGSGRVWMHPALAAAEREELAMAITALLYYGVLLEEMDA